MVGTDDLGSLSEIADMSRGQRTSDAASSVSVVDIRPEADRLVIARREWWRELKKLNPAQFSELQQTRAREQEGHENRARTGDDAVDEYEPPKPHRTLTEKYESSISSTASGPFTGEKKS